MSSALGFSPLACSCTGAGAGVSTAGAVVSATAIAVPAAVALLAIGPDCCVAELACASLFTRR